MDKTKWVTMLACYMCGAGTIHDYIHCATLILYVLFLGVRHLQSRYLLVIVSETVSFVKYFLLSISPLVPVGEQKTSCVLRGSESWVEILWPKNRIQTSDRLKTCEHSWTWNAFGSNKKQAMLLWWQSPVSDHPRDYPLLSGTMHVNYVFSLIGKSSGRIVIAL